MPKKTLHFPALVLFGIYAIYGFVLYPITEKVASDVVLSDTFLIYILEFLLPLTEWLGLAAAIGFVAYSIFQHGTRRSVPLFVLTAGAILFKSIAYFISYSVQRGSLQFGYHGRNTIASLLLANLVEALVLALMALVIHYESKRFKETERVKSQACKRLGQELPAESKRFFNFKKPLFHAALWGTVPYTAFRLFLFISSILPTYDFLDFYWIVIMLFTSVVIPAVSCFFCSLLCIKLTVWYVTRMEERQADEAADGTAQGE